MSVLTSPSKCIYFFSAIYREDFISSSEIRLKLSSFLPSEPLEYFFPQTPESLRLLTYYAREMGDNLSRILYVFPLEHERDKFVDFKIKATALEDSLSVHGKRRLNLDVGQLNLENMQLLSGKMYAHRVYLRDGVYSDLHYLFKAPSFSPLPWCYPDYAQAPVIEFFNHLRSMLLVKLKSL